MDTVTPLDTPRETIQDSASQDSASILSYPINNVNVNSESVSELSGVSDCLSIALPNGINFGMTAHNLHTTDTCTCTTNSTRTSLLQHPYHLTLLAALKNHQFNLKITHFQPPYLVINHVHLVLPGITATHGLNTLLLKMQCFVTHAVFLLHHINLIIHL